MNKLSASGMALFLKSPKAFYWRYKARLEPITQSVMTYDHDKMAGSLWSEFVARFYDGVREELNTGEMLADWHNQTDGWVPEKMQAKLTNALTTWGAAYYTQFSRDDGVRIESEVLVEDDRFLGYLDGISKDGIIHECKSTSRSPQLSGQLWKVQHSIQVKLYSVLTEAQGAIIEFAWKDNPVGIFRAPVMPITPEMRKGWRQELEVLADYIQSLGDDPHNYPCHPDGCCITGKGMTSMCQYDVLCEDGLTDMNRIAYRAKENRRK